MTNEEMSRSKRNMWQWDVNKSTWQSRIKWKHCETRNVESIKKKWEVNKSKGLNVKVKRNKRKVKITKVKVKSKMK